MNKEIPFCIVPPCWWCFTCKWIPTTVMDAQITQMYCFGSRSIHNWSLCCDRASFYRSCRFAICRNDDDFCQFACGATVSGFNHPWLIMEPIVRFWPYEIGMLAKGEWDGAIRAAPAVYPLLTFRLRFHMYHQLFALCRPHSLSLRSIYFSLSLFGFSGVVDVILFFFLSLFIFFLFWITFMLYRHLSGYGRTHM